MNDYKRAAGAVFLALIAYTPVGAQTKICFMGDSGVGTNAVNTHNVCKNNGAQAIVHTGDLDYKNSPSSWESFINARVGSSFPYFYVLGNHDTANASGYRSNLTARLNRLGITWNGTVASHFRFDWRGIRFIMTTPGLGDSSAATYIRDQAAATTAPWVLSIFHEQMAKMNVGNKGDSTGWTVFENARLQGVTTWNGHEHSYGRTHLLSDMDTQTIADNTSPTRSSKGARWSSRRAPAAPRCARSGRTRASRTGRRSTTPTTA